MTEPIKVESPTGCVHIAKLENITVGGSKEYLTLCNQREGYWYFWPLTDKPVTCRKCLGKSIDRMDQLAGLARKCLDMEIRFWGLIKNCKYFVENRVFNPVSHSYININICKHRRRLGTEKNPKLCTLVDCPLKYER